MQVIHLVTNLICTLKTLWHNGRNFADDPLKRIFLNKTVRISNKISPKFVPKGPINFIPALIQIIWTYEDR